MDNQKWCDLHPNPSTSNLVGANFGKFGDREVRNLCGEFFFLGRFAKIWFSRKINAVPFLPYYGNSDNNKLWINQLILSMIHIVLNINLLTMKIRILFHFYLMFLQIYNSFFWKDKMFCISFGCWKFLNFLSNKTFGNYCFENIRLIQSFFSPLSGLD